MIEADKELAQTPTGASRYGTRRACDRATISPHLTAVLLRVLEVWTSRLLHSHSPTMSTAPPIFTATSAYSLAFVASVGLVAYVAAKVLLPKDASWQDRFTFIWLVCVLTTLVRRYSNRSSAHQAFDGAIHYTLEGSFVYYSMFGRQVNTSSGPMAQMCTF